MVLYRVEAGCVAMPHHHSHSNDVQVFITLDVSPLAGMNMAVRVPAHGFGIQRSIIAKQQLALLAHDGNCKRARGGGEGRGQAQCT